MPAFLLFLSNGDKVGVLHTEIGTWTPGDELASDDGRRFRVFAILDLPVDEVDLNGALVVTPL
jgi:hypothetical protein